MREFVRDIVLRTIERTRGEVSKGIQDAVVPMIAEFVTVLLYVSVILLVLFLISRKKRK